jgi:hypothetical protein
VSTAAQLFEIATNIYPCGDEVSSTEDALKYVPNLLEQFLRSLFVGKDIDLKVAAIAQAMIQAIRPRAIMAPLQFALGIQMHHHFATKFLINTLHSMGFCSSYYTVQNYEKSAAVSQVSFIQYVADNVDHNIRTLDGHGTFHGMGIIAAITPGTMRSRPIPRKSVTTEQIANAGKLVIRHYNRSNENQQLLVYKELKDLKVQDSFAHLDLLYKLKQPLIRSPRPAWSGTMQMIFKGEHPMKSSVQFLPMIDMDPSNLTCIYSTLSFIVDQAKRYNLIPIITFNQPLWWKALLIVLNEPGDSDMKSIVLRLGGLHIQMSFLGCIGHIMAGSGLQDVLELVYAKNAVVHMLSRKAIARAIRGHFLVDSALNCLLMRDVFNLPYQVNGVSGNQEEAEDGSSIEEIGEHVPATKFDDDLKQADLLFKRLLLEEVNINEVGSAEILTRLSEEVETKKRSMENQ